MYRFGAKKGALSGTTRFPLKAVGNLFSDQNKDDDEPFENPLVFSEEWVQYSVLIVSNKVS